MYLPITQAERAACLYRRRDFAGDVFWACYAYADIDGMMTPLGSFARDSRCPNDPAYVQALCELLTSLAADEELGYETIFDRIAKLRLDTFGRDGIETMKRNETPFTAQETVIDQSAIIANAFADRSAIIYCLADTRYIDLLRTDLANTDRSLCMLVIGPEGGCLPTKAFLEAGGLGDIPTVYCDSLTFDPTKLEASLSANAGTLGLAVYGEEGFFLCRGLTIPSAVIAIPHAFTSKVVSGCFSEALCRVFVPAGFDPQGLIPIRARTVASYRQLAKIAEEIGTEAYTLSPEALYSRFPALFFSIYDDRADDLPEGMTLAKAGDLADYMAKRDRAILDYINTIPGMRAFSAYWKDGTLSDALPWGHTEEADGITVHGIVLDEAARSEVILAKGGAISPRDMLRSIAESEDEIRVFSNFLFFLTPRLAENYNRQRADRTPERIDFDGGHMDYMLVHEDGHRIETVPLYKKACIGLKDDGGFVFYHHRLRGGQLALNGAECAWTAADVDPADAGDVCVYTPYMSLKDEEAPTMEYTLPVGEGRYNLVFIQDRLIAARHGDVLLPSIGIVVSMNETVGARFFEKAKLEPGADGYCVVSKDMKPVFRLEGPAEISPDEWAKVRWAFGGGLSLITKGHSVFGGDDSAAYLSEEGWFTPLSRQTQESEIHKLARHPRTSVGVTKDGKLFVLVFSGRTPLSTGADYVEMCAIAKSLIPNAAEMMNVDGGGSSVLGLGIGSRFIELSVPSTSNASAVGMVRPINTILCLRR